MNQSNAEVLGIDPGLNNTGYAILNLAAAGQTTSLKLVEAGIISSRSNLALGERILELYRGLLEVIDSYQPKAMAIEELYSHYARPRTAILMGHARGAFLLAAAQRRVPVFSYGATQVKKVMTGNGRAPKDQIQLAVMRQFGLSEPPEPADVADAIAIATCHHHLTSRTIS